MIWRGIRLAGAVLLAAGLVACGRGKGVARVGGAPLTQDDYRAFLASGPQAGAEGSAESLRALVDEEAAANEARGRGLDREREFIVAQRLFADNLLASEFLKARYARELDVPDARLKDEFRRTSEQRHLRHVLVKDQEQAEAICRALRAGKDFAQEARALSLDKGSAPAGGDLGWHSAGEFAPAFADAAFALKEGEVSRPVKTEFGWHVVQCLGVHEADDSVFEREKKALRLALQRRVAQHLLEKAAADGQRTIRCAVHEEALQGDFGLEALPEDSGKVVANVGAGRAITMEELKQYMGGYFRSKGQMHVLGPSAKRQFLDLLVKSAVVAEKARQEGIGRRPGVAAALREEARSSLANALKAAVLKELRPSEGPLRAWFDSRPKELAVGDEIHLFYITAASRERAEEAARSIRGGLSFQEAAKRFSSDEGSGAQGGDASWVSLARLEALLPKAEFAQIDAAPPGKVVGPALTSFGWQIFQSAGRRAGAPLDFQKDHDAVAAAYVAKFGESLWKDQVEAWKKSLGVKIYPENLPADGP